LAQSIQTALTPNPALGSALVTHPFHPLSGGRFPVLKTRKIGGQEVLTLYDKDRGIVCIPREWTDRAVFPQSAGLTQPAPILEVCCLLKLCDLVRMAGKKIDDE